MKEKTSISQKLQKFGSVLAGMVIPNIGAFIGFGLITAFFLETGWTPNAKLAKLISPILNYLLPILIGHTGGKMFGGDIFLRVLLIYNIHSFTTFCQRSMFDRS